jgi:hypothetical protein
VESTQLLGKEDVYHLMMSNRMKRFITNSVIAAFVLGTISVGFEQIGPMVAGDYYTPIMWGIRLASFAVLGIIVWRFCVGIKNGRLLFDDQDE